MNPDNVVKQYRVPSIAVIAIAVANAAGCAAADEGEAVDGPRASSGHAVAMQPLAGMPLVASIAVSENHVVEFYDSSSGVVIRELGPAAEADQHVDLAGMRGLGMTTMYRRLAKDDQRVVPPALLEAEKKQQALQAQSYVRARQTGTTAAAVPPVAPTARPRITSVPASGNTVVDPSDDTASIAQALGGLSTDASWWASLPVSQYKEITYPQPNSFGFYSSWFDVVRSQTDLTFVETWPQESEYYEATAFAQGDDATFVIFRYYPNFGYTTFVDTVVPYRTWQTISAPSENGAEYCTDIYTASGNVVGYSERLRVAMPQPKFLNNNPDNVSYDFSNDIQGITHDDDNWYLSRTEYDHSFDPLTFPPIDSTPVYGQLAKIPFTSSLSSQPQQVVTMPGAWLPSGGDCTSDCDSCPAVCSPAIPGYDHFGDLVRVDSRLYVSMQGDAGGALAVYDLDLNPITIVRLPHNTGASLVAYNSQDGLFYVGGENPDGPNTLQKYWVHYNDLTGLHASYIGTLYLSQAIPSMQGAKFSSRGNLWLLTGYGGSDRNFWGIDAVTGTVLVQGTLDAGDADEAEGLDIIDLDRETRPAMGGQLHLMMLDNHAFGDAWWLMHWSAPIGQL